MRGGLLSLEEACSRYRLRATLSGRKDARLRSTGAIGMPIVPFVSGPGPLAVGPFNHSD